MSTLRFGLPEGCYPISAEAQSVQETLDVVFIKAY